MSQRETSNLLARIPVELHDALREISAQSGISIRVIVTAVLDKYAGRYNEDSDSVMKAVRAWKRSQQR